MNRVLVIILALLFACLGPQAYAYNTACTMTRAGMRYDAELGGRVSPDPLGHATSMSLYDYCNGDPVNGLDPTGRIVIQDLEAAQQRMLLKGGALNNIGAYGISFGMTAFNVFSLGNFSKTDSLVDQNLYGQISDQQMYSSMATNTGVRVAAVATFGAVGASIPATAAGVKLVQIGAGAGIIGGVGSTAVSDYWKGSVSSPQTYFSNGVGGAFGGITTAVSGNPIAGGAVNGFMSSTLDDFTNGNELNSNRIGFNTGIGAFSGWLSNLFPWKASIDGINAGRNSFGSIAGQIGTKVENGTINDFTLSTMGKIGAYELMTNVPRDTVYGAVQSYMDNSLFGTSETGTHIQQDPVGKFVKH